MLVKKIYTIIFYFLQDLIELIFWFCVGDFFGHLIFYIFIKNNKARKKSSTKDITDFFEKCKKRMAEKPTSIEEKFESLTLLQQQQVVDPRKEFLLNLD